MMLEKIAADVRPADAVIITIWHSGGRTVADVNCSCPAAEAYAIAEFPRPVPVALERAEQLCERFRLQRICVVLTDDALWRSDWGQLVSRPQ